MKKFRFAILTSVIILSGCKTDITAVLPFSGFISDGIKTTKAELRIEVPACEDFEDSRKESSSLSDAKKMISNLFSTAEYVDCHKIKFDSFATFTLPVSYGKVENDWNANQNIAIVMAEPEGQPSYLTLFIPDDIKKTIDKNQNEKFSLEKIDLETLKINFTLKNDTDKDISASALPSFVNSEAVLSADYTIKPNQDINVTLSNVSSVVAFKLNTDEYPLILNNIKF